MSGVSGRMSVDTAHPLSERSRASDELRVKDKYMFRTLLKLLSAMNCPEKSFWPKGATQDWPSYIRSYERRKVMASQSLIIASMASACKALLIRAEIGRL